VGSGAKASLPAIVLCPLTIVLSLTAIVLSLLVIVLSFPMAGRQARAS